MTLITRQGKPIIKLNIEELDNNFSYLEQLAQQGGGGTLTTQEVEIQAVRIGDLFSESANPDFTQPLSQTFTTNFTGIKTENEVIGDLPEGEGPIKLKSTSLLGKVDSKIIGDILFGSDLSPEEEEFFGLLLFDQLTIDYKLSELFLEVEGEFVPYIKLISLTLKGQPIFEPNVGTEISQYYQFEGDSVSHELKLSDLGFDSSTFNRDNPNIYKVSIDEAGNFNEIPLRIRFDNLPNEQDAFFGHLFIDEGGFVKVKQ